MSSSLLRSNALPLHILSRSYETSTAAGMTTLYISLKQLSRGFSTIDFAH